MPLYFHFPSAANAKAFVNEIDTLLSPEDNGPLVAIQGDDLSLENKIADPYSTEVSAPRRDSVEDEDLITKIAAKHGGCFVGTVR